MDQEALDGGFRYGEITAVAGGGGVGKSLVGFSRFFFFLGLWMEK